MILKVYDFEVITLDNEVKKELKEMPNISYIYEDSESTDLYLKGYVFRSDFKNIGHFIFYKDDYTLELYDLYDDFIYCCKISSISDIKLIIQKNYYFM